VYNLIEVISNEITIDLGGVGGWGDIFPPQ
jgi:hypothetical protein